MNMKKAWHMTVLGLGGLWSKFFASVVSMEDSYSSSSSCVRPSFRCRRRLFRKCVTRILIATTSSLQEPKLFVILFIQLPLPYSRYLQQPRESTNLAVSLPRRRCPFQPFEPRTHNVASFGCPTSNDSPLELTIPTVSQSYHQPKPNPKTTHKLCCSIVLDGIDSASPDEW